MCKFQNHGRLGTYIGLQCKYQIFYALINVKLIESECLKQMKEKGSQTKMHSVQACVHPHPNKIRRDDKNSQYGRKLQFAFIKARQILSIKLTGSLEIP